MKYYSDMLAEAGKHHLFDTKKELDEAEASHKAAIEEAERLAKERNDAIDAITLAIEQFRTKYGEEYASAYSRKKFEEALEKMKAKTTTVGGDHTNSTSATQSGTVKLNNDGSTVTNAAKTNAASNKQPEADGKKTESSKDKARSHDRPITFGEFVADLIGAVYGL